MRRISVAGMMSLILLVAIGTAAITFESELWCSALYSLSLVVLGVAIVAAAICRGLDRAFWLGFALFGCGYSFLSYSSLSELFPWSSVRVYSLNRETVPRPRIVTELFLDWIYQYVAHAPTYKVGANVQVQWGSPSSYFPAVVTKMEPARVEILWQGYTKGLEEWVTPNRVQGGQPIYFHATGHAVLTLILGLFGGLLCRAVLSCGLWEHQHGSSVRQTARASDLETSANH